MLSSTLAVSGPKKNDGSHKVNIPTKEREYKTLVQGQVSQVLVYLHA